MKILLLFLSLCFTLPLLAQESQKDTTQTKKKKDSIRYGANTTRYFYEQDFLEKRQYHYLDTNISHLHRYNYLQKADNKAQDLGTLGTAFQFLGYQAPQEIGARLGTDVFEPYQRQNPKFYNNMSPFSQIYYVQGGKGRTNLDIDLSRNISPDWNVNFFFKRIEADKVLVKSVRENDAWTFNQTYALNTSYQSRKYSFLLDISHVEHTVNEMGGIVVPDSTNNLNFIDTVENDAQIVYQLQGVSNTQTRHKLRFLQEFFLDSALQIYHALDWTLQRNRYTDKSWQSQKSFYPFFFFDSTRNNLVPSAVLVGEKWENEAGIKGKIGKLFYRAYLKNRNWTIQREYIYNNRQENLHKDSIFVQNLYPQWFLGGKINYSTSNSEMTAQSEILKEGDYQLNLSLKRKNLQASLRLMSYSPSIIEKEWRSNFYSWDSSQVFRNTQLQEIKVQVPFYLNFSSSSLQIQLKGRLLNLNRLIYFDTKGVAQQSQDLQILELGVYGNWTKGFWNASAELSFSPTEQFSVVRIPFAQANLQVFYQNKLFRRGILSQLGADLHWKSAYYADAYMPALLQYHLQNRFRVENYPLLDIFFNVKVSKALFFAKITNLFQEILTKGYFQTPPHLAQPRAFELGLHWRFFD